MRARSVCSHCGAIGKAEFRDKAGRLLRELADTDAGHAVGAVVDYGRRAARERKPG